MGVYKKKLKVRGNNRDEYVIDLYDDVTSCPEPNLPIKIKDKTVYAKLGEDTSPMGTGLMVHRDSDDKDYRVQSQSYLTVTINQSPNQTITVTHNGVAHTETFLCPYGDNLTATVSEDDGYEAGTLNFTEVWGIKANVTIEATEAIPIQSGSFSVPYNDREATTITIPKNIRALACKTSTIVGVTPGKSYTLHLVRGGKQGNYRYSLYCDTTDKYWAHWGPSSYTLNYSAEINKMTPTIQDY